MFQSFTDLLSQQFRSVLIIVSFCCEWFITSNLENVLTSLNKCNGVKHFITLDYYKYNIHKHLYLFCIFLKKKKRKKLHNILKLVFREYFTQEKKHFPCCHTVLQFWLLSQCWCLHSDAGRPDVQFNPISHLKATERQHSLHLIYQSDYVRPAAAGSDDCMFSIPR